jgi:hypothetical protein
MQGIFLKYIYILYGQAKTMSKTYNRLWVGHGSIFIEYIYSDH